MIEDMFNKRWLLKVEQSNNFKDLRPIAGFVKELLSWENSHKYIMMIQNELYSRRIIPFKINSINDLDKCNSLETPLDLLIEYICLSFKIRDKKDI